MQQPRCETAGSVEAFLRANPAFLRERPGLLAGLEPPERVHGEALADHMAAMLRAARDRAGAAERALAAAAAERRGADGFARRVDEAVLLLARAADPAGAVPEIAAVLQVDGARLCSEAAVPPHGAAAVPPGTIRAALGRGRAVLRPAADPDSIRALHGEAAALAGQEALLLVPLPGGPALLALACRDGRGLAGASLDRLHFLGEAMAAVLERGW